MEAYRAPGLEAAELAAREEISFVESLCCDVKVGTVFAVRRTWDSEGRIKEEFRTIAPPTGPALHARIWTVVNDEAWFLAICRRAFAGAEPRGMAARHAEVLARLLHAYGNPSGGRFLRERGAPAWGPDGGSIPTCGGRAASRHRGPGCRGQL